MRAWYLSDPEQECSPAILEGGLGCRLLLSVDGGGMEGLEPVGELELSEAHLGAAFGDTVKVCVCIYIYTKGGCDRKRE